MFGFPLSNACLYLRNPSTAVSTRTRKQVCLKWSSARNHWLCFRVLMCDCGPWRGPITFDINITESVWCLCTDVCVSRIRDATCTYVHKAVKHSQSWFCKEMQKPPVLVLLTDPASSILAGFHMLWGLTPLSITLTAITVCMNCSLYYLASVKKIEVLTSWTEYSCGMVSQGPGGSGGFCDDTFLTSCHLWCVFSCPE